MLNITLSVIILLGTALITSNQAILANDLSISYWIRNVKNYTDIENPRGINKKTIKFNPKKMVEKVFYDAQYKKKFAYKGYYLLQELNQISKGSKLDLMLLHFKNGMIVPLLFKHPKVQTKLNPFIATSIKIDNKWTDDFPEISRPDTRYRDPLPITFDKTKVVVTTNWFPMHPMVNKSGFSPWLHVDSLVGVEIANSTAYYRQFLPKDPEFTSGLKVFINRCQYCHSIRKIGSKFGWDFAGPIPIYKKRTVDSLTSHVKHKKAEPFKLGIRMPHQKDITRSEVDVLWQWMKHMTKQKKLNQYNP